MKFTIKTEVVLNKVEAGLLPMTRFRTFKVLAKNKKDVKAKIIAATVLVGESSADRTFKVNFTFCSPKDMEFFDLDFYRMKALERVASRKQNSPMITIRRDEKVMPLIKTMMLDWIKTPDAGFKQEGGKYGISWLKKVTPEMVV
jgi:hypothetical protein